jgi:Nitrile hydratase, alpha chain
MRLTVTNRLGIEASATIHIFWCNAVSIRQHNNKGGGIMEEPNRENTNYTQDSEATETGHRKAGEAQQENDRARRFSHIVARAWSDENFKKRLIAKPEEVFAEYALDVPAGTTIRVVENTDTTMHFILPAKPSLPKHIKLDRVPINILDSPCHGHEHSRCGDSGRCHVCGLSLPCARDLAPE